MNSTIHRASNAIHQFNIYLGYVNRGRSIKELEDNCLRYKRITTNYSSPPDDNVLLDRTEQLGKVNQFLDAIMNNNILYLEELYEKGYAPGYYRDTPYRLAVRWNSSDCLFFLYSNNCYNIKTAGLNGIMDIIAEMGTPELFDKIIEKYYNYIVDNKSIDTRPSNEPYTVADFYKDQDYINFTKVMLMSLKYSNMFMCLHLLNTEKYKEQIDFDTLYKIHDKLYMNYLHENSYTVSSLLTTLLPGHK